MRLATIFCGCIAAIGSTSITLMPIPHPHILRAEIEGFAEMAETAMCCPCEKPCQCENCGCLCMARNELNQTKTRGQ